MSINFFKCYGHMTDHENEEAKSRVIGSVSNATLIKSNWILHTKNIQIFSRIVSIFASSILNKPEGMI